jgi:hypothetical protein
MRKLLIIAFGVLLYSGAYAFDANVTNNPNSYAKVVTVSTSAATTLFTDNSVTGVYYDNTDSVNVVISSMALTSFTDTRGYMIPPGRTQPLYIPSNNFTFALSTGTASHKLSLILVE